jgi:protein-S-isoprenylcysteine O-methyltransferase Ste14
MLVAFAGTALALGEYRALLSLAIVLVTFYRKAKREERFLHQEFGDKVSDQVHRTGMFLPKFS